MEILNLTVEEQVDDFRNALGGPSLEDLLATRDFAVRSNWDRIENLVIDSGLGLSVGIVKLGGYIVRDFTFVATMRFTDPKDGYVYFSNGVQAISPRRATDTMLKAADMLIIELYSV